MTAMKSRRDTKQIILKSAFKLFGKEGFDRVSVDAIADAADITKRTVYYHFPSKDHILTAVLEHQHITDLADFENGWGTSK